MKNASVLALVLAQACSGAKTATIEPMPSRTTVTSNALIDSSSLIPSLSLINAQKNSVQALDGIAGHSAVITDGATLYLGTIGQALNIRADIATAGSVLFGFDGQDQYHIENLSPYAFASDANGVYNSWTPSLGDHVITVTPYADSGAQGVVGKSLTIHFKVAAGLVPSPLTISSFSLINASLNQAEAIDGVAQHTAFISDYSTIDLAKTGSSLNIRADIANPGSVLFNYDNGVISHIENIAPYALAADNAGIYNSWTPNLGNHVLKAAAYSGSSASGSAGQTLLIHFTVVDSSIASSTPTPTPTPGPTATPAPSPAPTAAPVASAPLSISSLTLINATTNQAQPLDGIAGHSAVLVDLASVDLSKTGSALNIRADIASVGSVIFDYDNGAISHIENLAPYALASDNAGIYNSWTPSVGNHVLKATAYSGTNASGTAGTSLLIHFAVKSSTIVTPTLTPPPSGFSLVEPSSYSAPIVISRGGTYTGNYLSMNMDVPAITVQTSEVVIIENSHIAGNSNLIYSPWSGVHLTIRNCAFHGKAPNVDDRARGQAITMPMFKNLIVENNYFENTGSAVAVDNYWGDGSLNETLRVRYNRVNNMDGRYRNGTGRHFENFVAIQNFVQGNGNPRGGDISWNEVINLPFQSSSEDLVNFYMAGGRQDSYFKLHDNFLQGSYPNPSNNTYASGSGLQIDGKDHTKTAYIEAYQNTVMQTCNGGMGAAAGSHVRIHHNRILSSSKLPDGSWNPASFGGVWIFDYYGSQAVGTMQDISIDSNLIGWANPNYSKPYASRNDITTNLNGWITQNQYYPNAPITSQMEADEYQFFLQKVQSNGVKIGPQ